MADKRSNLRQLVDSIANKLGRNEIVSPLTDSQIKLQQRRVSNKEKYGDWWEPGYEPAPPISPPSTPTIAPERPQIAGAQQVALSQGEVERKIREGLREYSQRYAGGAQLPIEKFVPMFVDASQKYPVFRQNPFLLPQTSILESSAGLNVTRENNPLNWGAGLQKAGQYSPSSWEQSIQDMITAVGGDVVARPPTEPSRHRQTKYYAPFRETGSLREFADIYEPANPDYYHNLTEGIKVFENR